MRPVIALVIAAALAGPAMAQDCTFENAAYTQEGSGWTVYFKPVPIDSAANQSSAFSLVLRTGAKLEGAVYWPNGYSTPIYSLEGPCGPQETKVCTFLDEDMPTVYVLSESGIEMMPESMDGPPPRQILLPRLASTLWYSFYREAEFGEWLDQGDVFTLKDCQPG